jgi:uncharacterized protein with ParB-like and HNH nuclease domain
MDFVETLIEEQMDWYKTEDPEQYDLLLSYIVKGDWEKMYDWVEEQIDDEMISNHTLRYNVLNDIHYNMRKSGTIMSNLKSTFVENE